MDSFRDRQRGPRDISGFAHRMNSDSYVSEDYFNRRDLGDGFNSRTSRSTGRVDFQGTRHGNDNTQRMEYYGSSLDDFRRPSLSSAYTFDNKRNDDGSKKYDPFENDSFLPSSEFNRRGLLQQHLHEENNRSGRVQEKQIPNLMDLKPPNDRPSSRNNAAFMSPWNMAASANDDYGRSKNSASNSPWIVPPNQNIPSMDNGPRHFSRMSDMSSKRDDYSNKINDNSLNSAAPFRKNTEDNGTNIPKLMDSIIMKEPEMGRPSRYSPNPIFPSNNFSLRDLFNRHDTFKRNDDYPVIDNKFDSNFFIGDHKISNERAEPNTMRGLEREIVELKNVDRSRFDNYPENLNNVDRYRSANYLKHSTSMEFIRPNSDEANYHLDRRSDRLLNDEVEYMRQNELLRDKRDFMEREIGNFHRKTSDDDFGRRADRPLPSIFDVMPSSINQNINVDHQSGRFEGMDRNYNLDRLDNLCFNDRSIIEQNEMSRNFIRRGELEDEIFLKGGPFLGNFNKDGRRFSNLSSNFDSRNRDRDHMLFEGGGRSEYDIRGRDQFDDNSESRYVSFNNASPFKHSSDDDLRDFLMRRKNLRNRFDQGNPENFNERDGLCNRPIVNLGMRNFDREEMQDQTLIRRFKPEIKLIRKRSRSSDETRSKGRLRVGNLCPSSGHTMSDRSGIDKSMAVPENKDDLTVKKIKNVDGPCGKNFVLVIKKNENPVKTLNRLDETFKMKHSIHSFFDQQAQKWAATIAVDGHEIATEMSLTKEAANRVTAKVAVRTLRQKYYTVLIKSEYYSGGKELCPDGTILHFNKNSPKPPSKLRKLNLLKVRKIICNFAQNQMTCHDLQFSPLFGPKSRKIVSRVGSDNNLIVKVYEKLKEVKTKYLVMSRRYSIWDIVDGLVNKNVKFLNKYKLLPPGSDL